LPRFPQLGSLSPPRSDLQSQPRPWRPGVSEPPARYFGRKLTEDLVSFLDAACAQRRAALGAHARRRQRANNNTTMLEVLRHHSEHHRASYPVPARVSATIAAFGDAPQSGSSRVKAAAKGTDFCAHTRLNEFLWLLVQSRGVENGRRASGRPLFTRLELVTEAILGDMS